MKKTAHFLVQKGFTLVELLIVIALIGILAVAILAAINPLEQLNRARDTGMESDASQLLAAIDRYFAVKEEFPWVTEDPLTYSSNDVALGDAGLINAQDAVIGICENTACAVGGVLLTTDELKSEFKNRRFMTSTAETGKLYLGKNTGASSSVYACWVPQSKAKRTVATHATDAVPSLADSCDPTGLAFTSLATACFYCIPR